MSALEDDKNLGSPEEGFRELFLQYHRAAVNLFRRYGFSDEESHELTQETFLRVYKGWTKFRGESQLSTWIFQIARNLALNEVRSRSTLKRETQESTLPDSPAPGDDLPVLP